MRALSGKAPRPFGRIAPVWLILACALVVRALVLLRTDPVAFDSALYFEMAEQMRAGQWAAALAYDFPPLFPALIAGIQSLGVGAGTAGLFVALAADLLVIFPLAAVARAAAGETAAWAAAFLWAIHPYAVRLGVQALTDAPTALFVALALWAGVRVLEASHRPSALSDQPEGPAVPGPAPLGRKGWAIGAGAASGLAYLLRPEGIEPAIMLAAALWIWPPHSGGQGHRGKGALRAPAAPDAGMRGREDAPTPNPASTPAPGPRPPARRPLGRAFWAAAPLVGWALVASPYIAFISLEAGSLTFSKKKSPAAFLRALGSVLSPRSSVLPPKPPTQESQPGGGGGGAGGRGEGPSDALAPGAGRGQSRLGRTAGSLYLFQRGLVNGLHPLVLAFGMLGAIALWRSGGAAGRPVRRLLVGLLGLHLGVLVGLAAARGAGYVGSHHFFPMVVYALPFAGAGLAGAIAWGAGRLRAPRLFPIAALCFLLMATASQSLLRRPGRGTALRHAAAWIRAEVPGRPVVVTDMAKLTYHAGAQRVDLRGGYDEIIRNARARSAQFVAFYPDMLRHHSPDFLPRIALGDLALARAFPEPSAADPGRRFEVYRLKPR